MSQSRSPKPVEYTAAATQSSQPFVGAEHIARRRPARVIVVLGAALVLLASSSESFGQGACCFEAMPGTITCQELPQANCSGTYFGEGSLCADQTGACVDANGCSIETQVDCEGGGNQFQGCGTTCPTGACCDGSGGCQIQSPAECLAAGSRYWGDGSSCTPFPCWGSCCDTDSGDCVTDLAEALCDGTWSATNSCTPNLCTGACCGRFQDCSETTPIGCDGVSLGVGTTCPPGGLCSLPEGACCSEPAPGFADCEFLTEAACTGIYGTWLGDQTACGPDPLTGPCALPTGACCVTQGSGDIFCVDDEVLSEVTERACENNNVFGGTGVYQGDDTTCTSDPCPLPDGACCGGSGGMDCSMQSYPDCPGFWFGGNSTCSPINPCLAPEGVCCFGGDGMILREDPCVESGGIWQEGTDESVCERACCLDGGQSCQVLSGVECSQLGGVPAQDYSTVCDGFACSTCSSGTQIDYSIGCCNNDTIIDAAKALCDIEYGLCLVGCFLDTSCQATCRTDRTNCLAGVPACDPCGLAGSTCSIILPGFRCTPPLVCHLITPTESRCGLPNEGQLVPPELCAAVFSPVECLAAQLTSINPLIGPVTDTFGITADAGAAVAVATEVGTIYSRDGKYGCFFTTCSGGGLMLAAGVGKNKGDFKVDFSGVAGHSAAICAAVDTPIANVGASACTVFVDTPENTCGPADLVPLPDASQCANIGTTVGLGVGVGMGGGSEVLLDCQTSVVEIGTFDGLCQLTVTNQTLNAAPACDAGGPYVSNTCDGATASVSLDGTASFDPNIGDTLTYSWTTSCPNAVLSNSSGATSTLQFDGVCSGTCLARLEVSDGELQSSCCASVIVNDGAPTISCPADVRVECGSDTSVSTTGNAIASDTCSGVTINTPTDSTLVNNCSGSNPGQITRTFTAVDACGYENTCEQVITGIDTIYPVITCPPDITIACTDSPLPENTGSATATDDCDSSLLIIRNDSDTLTGCSSPQTITRTWGAQDGCGNRATCNQIISVTIPGCGDGTQDPGEECDDGNTNDNDDCTNSCTNGTCGDGLIWNEGAGTEQCDDGNTDDGDGCTSICQIECGCATTTDDANICVEPRTCASTSSCDSAVSCGPNEVCVLFDDPNCPLQQTTCANICNDCVPACVDACDNSNDNCAEARLVTEGQTPFCNEQATTDGPSDCLGNVFVRDVWFRYVAPAAGILTVDTCTSVTFDTVIEAYAGSCGALIPGPCDNDTVCPPGSSIDVPVSNSEEILIRVGGVSISEPHVGTGVLTLSLTCGSGDCNCDGYVDLGDYVKFAACLLGPGGGFGTGCECFDFDNDNDNDLNDLAAFQALFSD